MSSLTSKLIRNAPGTEGSAAAEESGPNNNSSPASTTAAATAPGIHIQKLSSHFVVFHIFVFYYNTIVSRVWCFVSNLHSCVVVFVLSVPEDKAQPSSSLSQHSASSHASQSQTLEVACDVDEPVGDRWDDEDWGSLEV